MTNVDQKLSKLYKKAMLERDQTNEHLLGYLTALRHVRESVLKE